MNRGSPLMMNRSSLRRQPLIHPRGDVLVEGPPHFPNFLQGRGRNQQRLLADEALVDHIQIPC